MDGLVQEGEILSMQVEKHEDPKTGLIYWKTIDGRFAGVILKPFTLVADDEPDVEMPMKAGALLAVPKYTPRESPSINKYSPLVAQANTVEELGPLLDVWSDQNA